MKHLIINKALKIAIISITLSYLMISCTHNSKSPHAASQQRFDDIAFWVKMFEDPERDIWQKPAEVVTHLALKRGDVVVDIGAGTGYFTRHLAVAVGDSGKALGLDISPSMVKYMTEDASRLNLPHYVARVVKTDDPELGPNSVDVVFLSNTYHHIEKRVEYFNGLANSLNKHGRVVIVDFHENTPVGPQEPGHKVADNLVLDEMDQAGYRLIKSLDFLPYQYYLEFSL